MPGSVQLAGVDGLKRCGLIIVDGSKVTVELSRKTLVQELAQVHPEIGEHPFATRKFKEAAALLDRLITTTKLPAFLALEAYGLIY